MSAVKYSANKNISLSILKEAIIKLLISFSWLWLFSTQSLIRRLSHLGLVQECSGPSITLFLNISRVPVLVSPPPLSPPLSIISRSSK